MLLDGFNPTLWIQWIQKLRTLPSLFVNSRACSRVHEPSKQTFTNEPSKEFDARELTIPSEPSSGLDDHEPSKALARPWSPNLGSWSWSGLGSHIWLHPICWSSSSSACEKKWKEGTHSYYSNLHTGGRHCPCITRDMRASNMLTCFLRRTRCVSKSW